MNQIESQINELENYLGFSTNRLEINLESKWNEIFSYDLLQRFYNKDDELKTAINKAINILTMLIKSNNGNNKQISDHFSLLGNMYYIMGDFNKSIGCFMKSLSYNKNDLTGWVELMFSIRAYGDFRIFEDIIFNLEKAYRLWKNDTGHELTKEKMLSLIDRAKRIS
ncbi:hypothetical protein HYU09_02565 [Candidatus Woesearchaeota archaeon]|nr:hypothetical protein [Candidatus Woesearchaeota archaeon]